MILHDHGDGTSPKPKPSPDQPGTLAQQLATIATSIYLGERRRSTARDEWEDARRLCLPHVRRTDR